MDSWHSDSLPERSFWTSSSPPSLSAAVCVPSPPAVSSPPPPFFFSLPLAWVYGPESLVPAGQKRAAVIRHDWVKKDEYCYCIDCILMLQLTLDSMSRAFSSCASFNNFSISSIFSASIPLALWNTQNFSQSLHQLYWGGNSLCVFEPRQPAI